MKIFKQLILVCAFVAGLSFAVLPASTASAINVFPSCGAAGGGSTEVCKAASSDDATGLAKNVINTMLFILGIIAVIMIILGGIRYTTSAGDASRVKAAKDTIMYSIVGLVVAMLAFAIVNFVIGRV
jgi:glucose uptake protein GlcU